MLTIPLSEYEKELDLEIGQIYSIDLFQAERQTVGSNYGITTTIPTIFFSYVGVRLNEMSSEEDEQKLVDSHLQRLQSILKRFTTFNTQ